MFGAAFSGFESLLDSHRGWDPGALKLAHQMARSLHAPLFASSTTRLLIDLNRSMGNPTLYSEASRPLPASVRREIVDRFYRPHRDRVEGAVAAAIARGDRVVHIASHSFTPELNGTVRSADVAWLYDPSHAGESRFAADWHAALRRCNPTLRLRRNYPYQGRGDGLTTLLRRRHGPRHYVGIELEVNQRFVESGGAAWSALRRDLVDSLQAALAAPG